MLSSHVAAAAAAGNCTDGYSTLTGTGRPVDIFRQPDPEDRIPVTLITGFLGTGKTLLNRMSGGNHDLGRVPIIQNEFGAISIDDELTAEHVSTSAGDEILLNNGCICCIVKSDIESVPERLWLGQEEKGRLDRILVETNGLAKPPPDVVQTFVDDED